MGDALDIVFEALRSRLPLTADRIDEIEFELRERLGGDTHYIRRLPGADRRARVLAAHAAGASVTALADRFGYSQRHVRRIVSRKK